jgi:hypothetical protein
VVEIAASYSPSDHRSAILKHSASRDWSILDLSVDHSCHISAVQLA